MSRNMLSKSQIRFLQSQNYVITNKSENRKRIEEKVEGALNGLEEIVKSKRLDQEYKDKILPSKKVSEILKHMTYHKSKSSPKDEQNKFEIVNDMIMFGLLYYKIRFKKTRIIHSQINEFRNFVTMLQEFSEQEIQNSKPKKTKIRKKLV